MPLHVASYAESLAAASMGALEWLLTGVRVAVNAKGARAGESFVTSLADVAILRLWERCCRRRGNIMVVLPWVGTGRWHCDAHWHRWESLGGY